MLPLQKHREISISNNVKLCQDRRPRPTVVCSIRKRSEIDGITQRQFVTAVGAVAEQCAALVHGTDNLAVIMKSAGSWSR